MPRQRIHHSRVTYEVPDDFPERLERFKEESGLSWAEIIRRLDIHHETMRRWRKGRARPQHAEHDGAGGRGETPGPRPPVHRLGSRRSGERLPPPSRKRKKGGTHGCRASPHPHPVTPALPYGSGCIIIEASLPAVP